MLAVAFLGEMYDRRIGDPRSSLQGEIEIEDRGGRCPRIGRRRWAGGRERGAGASPVTLTFPSRGNAARNRMPTQDSRFKGTQCCACSSSTTEI